MVYNGYYKVVSNIPKMGQLPTPAKTTENREKTKIAWGSTGKTWGFTFFFPQERHMH